MKIWIEKADAIINEIGGKALFTRRLATEFRRRGYEVVSEGDADVSLNVIRIKHRHSKYKILRLDGVWHDTGKDWKAKNKGMRQSVKEADGVIYQSCFARRMCHEYLGHPKCPERVIFNGSDLKVWDSINPTHFQSAYNFIAFSKWRPHKRMRDIIESFIMADIEGSHLIIVGDGAKSGISKEDADAYFARPNIDYLGQLPQKWLMPLVKGATASIHLCWFDACPNSVVEAICAKTPVICNNTGGTWEIVGPSGGIIVPIDKPYDLKPVDLYHPPEIKRGLVAAAMREVAAVKPEVKREHVNIVNIAEQYLEFMTRIVT
jgi:glycosyltransferase involved in cell wall biosynthesis